MEPLRQYLQIKERIFLVLSIRNLTKKFNIKQYKTTAYHPQSNGSLERSHHVLIEYLKTQITKEMEWDEHIPLAVLIQY